jgi:hypothetical protein
MAYQVGGVTVQGDEPSNVIYAAFTPKVADGGKARILRRRVALSCSADALGLKAPDGFRFREDLTMERADPEDTRPSEMA